MKSLCGAGCRSLMPVSHCMFSAGRCVFWCPLAGAESDFCGRNGRWKGLIFRHNRVLVQNQGIVLKKSSHRGVHPSHFPPREGENERRPISCAHSSWIKRSTLLCRKMTWVHPVVSFPQKNILRILSLCYCKRSGLTFSFTVRTKNNASSLLYRLF